MATLASGTVLAQIIPVLISPLLTRLYSPDDFGVFAVYLSIVVLFVSIMTFRYEMAIVLPKEEDDAISLFQLSIAIAFLISLVLFLVFFFFKVDIANFLKTPKLSEYLLLVPVACLITAVYQCYGHWCNRTSQYKEIAISRVSNSFIMSVIQLIAGLKHSGSMSLIFGHLLGQLTALMVISRKKISARILISKIRLGNIKSNVVKYRNFPLFNTPHAFVDSSRDVLVNVFLLMISTASSVGIFMLVNRVMLSPVSVIGNAISQVLLRKLSEDVVNGYPIKFHIFKIIKVTFLIAAIPTFIVALFGVEIFSFIFGEDWKQAGDVARYFSLYSYLHFSASILSVVPIVLGKQKAAFVVNLFYTSCYVGSLILGLIFFENMLNAVQLFSVVMGIYFVFSFIWLFYIVDSYDKGLA